MTMKVFHCTFTGVYLGGYAVISARDRSQARRKLTTALRRAKLYKKQHEPPELIELPLDKPELVMLTDGDY